MGAGVTSSPTRTVGGLGTASPGPPVHSDTSVVTICSLRPHHSSPEDAGGSTRELAQLAEVDIPRPHPYSWESPPCRGPMAGGCETHLEVSVAGTFPCQWLFFPY